MKVMIMVISLTFVLLPCTAAASTSTQTDWSGGNGILGPVTDWGNQYYSDTDIQCYSSTSNITLSPALFTVKYTVDGDYTDARFASAADVNGDGYMDVLAASYTDDTIAWWKNNDGTGTSWTKQIVSETVNGPYCLYSADVNADGYIDIVGAIYNDDDIAWWENVDGTGTSWTMHTVDANCDGARSVCTGDFDGDGDIDIFACAYIANYTYWWENDDGTGTSWTRHTVSYFSRASSVCCADMNGDGYIDLLATSSTLDDVAWWKNNDGTGSSWTKYTIDGSFDGAVCINTADVDGDGYNDVIAGAYMADDIAWWKNDDGTGTSWTKVAVDEDIDNPASVSSADVDGDGDLDILGAARYASEIAWWENIDGSGTSFTKHVLEEDFTNARSVYAADLNGDGNMDVLGTAEDLNDIAWWNLKGAFSSSGSLESSILDTQESPRWLTINWTSTEPSGTSVAFLVRASDDSLSMGVWSDTLTSPCSLSVILADQHNYMQYRTILSTTDSLLTPSLDDVTLEWELWTGTQEESIVEVSSFAFYGAQPNPAAGHATLVFSLPVASRAELAVYDLTGRTVRSSTGDFEQGTHDVVLNDLPSGAYLVRMTSGEFTATQRFVVIK